MSLNSKPNLVLLHGWGFTAAVWDALRVHLELHFTVTALNLPGYGDAEPIAAMHDLAVLADDVVQRAPLQAVWLGWSLGGMVALQAAAMFPQRIQSLVLVGSTPRFIEEGDWLDAVRKSVLHNFAQELVHARDSVIGRFLSLQFLGVPGGREQAREILAAQAQDPSPGVLEGGLNILEHADLRPLLSKIQQPALWLTGERDRLTPPVAAQRAAEQMPHAITESWSAAGHAPFLVEPERFARRIHDFVLDVAAEQDP
jgi:pimeloyl-[acyl-carrier protein] methyl ester esterase